MHEKDGWYESKVGSIYWRDEHFRRHERYLGRFDNSEKLGFYLWLEACRWDLREAKKVVYLGDGAGWIRTVHNIRFNRAVFIVDWYHVSEHIWDCGKVLFGEGSDATKRRVEHRCSLSWDVWTRKLLNDLKKGRKKYRGKKRDAIDTPHRYISVNEQQMRYDVFPAAGYDIGSGTVEGACKHVVGKRLKQSGMIWTRVARLFPNEASLLRLVSAIEMEISEDWIAGKRYLDMTVKMENEDESVNSKEIRIYRKNVA